MLLRVNQLPVPESLSEFPKLSTQKIFKNHSENCISNVVNV